MVTPIAYALNAGATAAAYGPALSHAYTITGPVFAQVGLAMSAVIFLRRLRPSAALADVFD